MYDNNKKLYWQLGPAQPFVLFRGPPRPRRASSPMLAAASRTRRRLFRLRPRRGSTPSPRPAVVRRLAVGRQMPRSAYLPVSVRRDECPI